MGLSLFPDSRLNFDFATGSLRITTKVRSTYSLHYPITRLSPGEVAILVGIGSENILCLWDTGAVRTVIDTAFIASHPTQFTESGELEVVDGTGAIIKIKKYVISQLKIGNIEFLNEEILGGLIFHRGGRICNTKSEPFSGSKRTESCNGPWTSVITGGRSALIFRIQRTESSIFLISS